MAFKGPLKDRRFFRFKRSERDPRGGGGVYPLGPYNTFDLKRILISDSLENRVIES